MTDAEKLVKIKKQLNISDTSLDVKLNDYIDSARKEILSWIYINYPDKLNTVTEVPAKYDITHCQAVVTAFTMEGMENSKQHNENGISNSFDYSCMIDFIHSHVWPKL